MEITERMQIEKDNTNVFMDHQGNFILADDLEPVGQVDLVDRAELDAWCF